MKENNQPIRPAVYISNGNVHTDRAVKIENRLQREREIVNRNDDDINVT